MLLKAVKARWPNLNGQTEKIKMAKKKKRICIIFWFYLVKEYW